MPAGGRPAEVSKPLQIAAGAKLQQRRALSSGSRPVSGAEHGQMRDSHAAAAADDSRHPRRRFRRFPQTFLKNLFKMLLPSLHFPASSHILP